MVLIDLLACSRYDEEGWRNGRRNYIKVINHAQTGPENKLNGQAKLPWP